VLPLLLAHSQPDYVARLLTGIEAVLVELPDLEETWQLFGAADLPDVLEQLGLVREPAE
jgi:hypothetical protein